MCTVNGKESRRLHDNLSKLSKRLSPCITEVDKRHNFASFHNSNSINICVLQTLRPWFQNRCEKIALILATLYPTDNQLVAPFATLKQPHYNVLIKEF